MTRATRAWSAVPRGLWGAFFVLLGAQLWAHGALAPRAPLAADLAPAPRAATLRLAALGDAALGARLAMLYLQSYDTQASNTLAYRQFDYARLAGWLRAALDADPRGRYPLFAAVRIYAEVPDPARIRVMLEFVYAAFLEDPQQRWPWLAHAAILAKHRLNDLALARRYAAAMARLADSPEVPPWAQQMEAFILEDMGELQAAKVLLGGLLDAGRIADPGEARFLRERLETMEERLRTQGGRDGRADGDRDPGVR